MHALNIFTVLLFNSPRDYMQVVFNCGCRITLVYDDEPYIANICGKDHETVFDIMTEIEHG
jgi:hypothetical protein